MLFILFVYSDIRCTISYIFIHTKKEIQSNIFLPSSSSLPLGLPTNTGSLGKHFSSFHSTYVFVSRSSLQTYKKNIDFTVKIQLVKYFKPPNHPLTTTHPSVVHSKEVVLLLLIHCLLAKHTPFTNNGSNNIIVAPIVCEWGVFGPGFVMQYLVFFFSFAVISPRKRAGYFALIMFLLLFSCYCSMSLTRGDTS